MARVYLAAQRGPFAATKLVVLKYLRQEVLNEEQLRAMFVDEARIAVRLNHPNVVHTYEAVAEDGDYYIVMEYLEGLDLSAWLQQRGRLPVDQAVEFVLQACEAIAEAHSLGIVHRDLKPANLFVIRRPDGGLSVKVLDFGIAKRTGAAGAAAAAITSTAAVMGSPLYMSPEQLNSSKDADARTDVWALGVILHELLSGDSPFIAETMPGVMMKITASEPPPLRAPAGSARGARTRHSEMSRERSLEALPDHRRSCARARRFRHTALAHFGRTHRGADGGFGHCVERVGSTAAPERSRSAAAPECSAREHRWHDGFVGPYGQHDQARSRHALRRARCCSDLVARGCRVRAAA